MRLYADSTKCCGCRACQVACSLNLFVESNPKKGALAILAHFPEPGTYEAKVCTQCGECAAVCPVEAIKQDARGVYTVDFATCTLCGACEPVCPESVMYVRAALADSAWKCNLCGDCVPVCGMSVLSIAD
jgi:Fe-S-cluster-containing hydrogenase component 2